MPHKGLGHLVRGAAFVYAAFWTVFTAVSIFQILQDGAAISYILAAAYTFMPIALWGYVLRKPLWKPVFWKAMGALALLIVSAFVFEAMRVLIADPREFQSFLGYPFFYLLAVPGFIWVYRYPYICFPASGASTNAA